MSDIVEMLRQGSLTRDDYRWKAADEITRLTARVAELEEGLVGILWMAEEWFEHTGSSATFSDDYEKELEAVRAILTTLTPMEKT